MKTIAKQQQSVALSSCEAELYALQSVSQESIALAAFCMRVYSGLQECHDNQLGYLDDLEFSNYIAGLDYLAI